MTHVVKARPTLRVRSGPGTGFRIVGKLPNGTAVEIVEKAPAGAPWAFVSPGSGWVHIDHLVVKPAPAPTPRKPGASTRPRTTWRVAHALATLRKQVNAMAPGRSRSADGTIGDAAHASRKSDHNPNADGVVTALDITHDPARGCDCRALVDALVKSRDPRIKYVIFQGQILSSRQQPWVWRPYTGANAHRKHLHVSVDADPALYDDTRPWSLA